MSPNPPGKNSILDLAILRSARAERGPASRLLTAAIVAAAVLAGAATAMVAGVAGMKAVYYAAIFGTLGAGVLFAATRDDPLRLAWLALLTAFPIANTLVPPGRIGLKVFDAVMLLTALALVARWLTTRESVREPLFPGRSWVIAWALSIPCVLFSMFPGLSAAHLLVNVGAYAFFLMSLREMQQGGFDRVVAILSFVVAVLSVGQFVDYFLHINLSMRGSNFNQLSYAGGEMIWRAAGFFQDPQVAGAFLSCAVTFLLVLLVRGRYTGSRLRIPVALAVMVGFAGLLTTVSRGAIAACVVVSAASIFLFNRWPGPIKVLSVLAFAVIATTLAMLPLDALLGSMPEPIAKRFAAVGENFETRLTIWFDTWEMFAENPVTGIGMGSFRPYLLETRPGVENFYGIGLGSGEPYIPDQPENGYLHLIYEGGIVGAAAALLVAGDAVRRAMQVIRRSNRRAAARTDAVAALAGLVAFAITFLTLFTWTDSRVCGLFLLLVAIIWWRSLEARTPGVAAGATSGRS